MDFIKFSEFWMQTRLKSDRLLWYHFCMRAKTGPSRLAYSLLLLDLGLAACTRSALPADGYLPSPNLENPPAGAATNPTPLPAFTPLPTGAATPPPFVAFHAEPWADNVLVRTGPGTLFDASRMIPAGMRLLVLGRSPGGEWVYVELPDGVRGWVFAQLLQGEQDLQSAPLFEPEGLQQVQGLVLDATGLPTSGVVFMLAQGSRQTNAVTDAGGVFHAFLPGDAGGAWTVSYTGISCTSNTMDVDCNCKGGVCGKPSPETTTVNLPQAVLLSFTWK
ncbi:MAG: SH3 domain-containing protein [Chloroflexi bacterium]|nr:SH3 domain-containing protein [Chloroflexota bacterium]